jgi:hypothetical protein
MANGAVVTTAGKGLIAASMLADTTAAFVAHGTGTTTPAASQTGLVAAVDLDTASAWAGTESVSASVKYRVLYAMACTATRSITEVGLFDDAPMTAMLYREVFTAIAVNNLDTITYTIDITVG